MCFELFLSWLLLKIILFSRIFSNFIQLYEVWLGIHFYARSRQLDLDVTRIQSYSWKLFVTEWYWWLTWLWRSYSSRCFCRILGRSFCNWKIGCCHRLSKCCRCRCKKTRCRVSSMSTCWSNFVALMKRGCINSKVSVTSCQGCLDASTPG